MLCATPTIAAQSQQSLPTSALKIHQASDGHSGENLGVVPGMFELLQLQVSRYRCARRLSPKATHLASPIFANFSLYGRRGDIGCRALHGKRMQLNARICCETFLDYRSLNPATPSARLMPTCPSTDNGCSEMVRFDPPTNTLAPSPNPRDALPLAPT